MAELHANGLLTVVAAPDAQVEQDRDLLRSRQQLVQQQGALHRHIQSLLQRNGLHYKAETRRKTLWQTHHYGWLDRTIDACSGSLKVNLSLLVRQLKSLDEILAAYGEAVEALAQALRYRELNIDIETCRECGGAVKVIACIEDPGVIEKILTHLHEKAASAATGLLPERQAPP